MKKIFTILPISIALLFGLSNFAWSQTAPTLQEKTVTIISGETRTEPLGFTPGNIIVGDPNVCNFIALRETKEITLVAKKAGQTTITVQDLQKINRLRLNVRVIVSDRARVANELRALLKDVEGVEIKIIGKKVLIDGEILLPQHLNRIITVSQQYAEGEVGVVASLSPLAQKIIAEKMEEDIHKKGFKEVSVRAINQRFLIEGGVEYGSDVDPDKNAKIVIKSAESYVPPIFITEAEQKGILKKPAEGSGGPPAVVNLLIRKPKPAAEAAKIIRITAHYVELNKNYAKNFRFNWTPGISDETKIDVKNGSLTSTISGTISSLIPKLDNAKTHGHARVLEASSLIVQDQQQGILKNATQIPITVLSAQGGGTVQGTEFKDVGLTMEIKPTVLPETSQVRLEVNFDLLTILDFNAQGVPSISHNNVTTVLILNAGESAALGGLVTSNIATNFNRLPAHIAERQNILFNLYRSKSFQNNKSQFVVFITPEILPSASEGAEKLKRKFRLK